MTTIHDLHPEAPMIQVAAAVGAATSHSWLQTRHGLQMRARCMVVEAAAVADQGDFQGLTEGGASPVVRA